MNAHDGKVKLIHLFILAALSIQPGIAAQPKFSTVQLDSINFNWRFYRGHNPNAKKVEFDDSNWRIVNLPHDYSIEDLPNSHSPFSADSIDKYDTGYTVGGIAWYRKSLVLTNEQISKIAILQFGGIYMNSEVYMNGRLVGGQYYGYTSFYIDITNYLYQDGRTNIIAVKVNNNHLNSRWYSGSGIYRPISLTFFEKTFFEPYGTSIKTRLLSSNQAEINIESPLFNQSTDTQTVDIVTQILDASGKVIVVAKTPSVQLQAGINPYQNSILLPHPNLWSAQIPHLYQLKQSIIVDGQTLSTKQTRFGVRELKFDPDKGFLVNGKPVLLKGMNVHHDNYLLGAEAWPDAEFRKIKKIKAAGYNAIRTAHNPPSKAFLDAADELGVYVINEAFDAWNQHKGDHKNDYASHFKLDWQRDLTQFIKRDRNHPSVIMWSIGNEIPEQVSELGISTAKQLIKWVEGIDNTRPVTIGANVSDTYSDKFLSQFDVVGYNYQKKFYLSDHKRFPKRLMYGSESHSNKAFEYWQYVKNHNFIIGDFVWTGWDYLGESSIGWTGYAPEWKGLADYPWTLAYCGEIDALGYKRPSAYYRDVLWKTGNNPISMFVKSPTPSLSPQQNPDWYLYWTQEDLHPNWTWPGFEQNELEVVVYSVLPTVELKLNGKSIGKKSLSSVDKHTARFMVPYQAGELTAIGYNKAGKASAQWALQTSGKPTQVKLSADRNSIRANGQDLVYLTAELYDDNGYRVYHWNYDLELSFDISGVGRLLAVGNANPRSVESFITNKRKTFRGKALAVIQSLPKQAGDIVVSVRAKELKPQQIKLTSSAIK